MGLERGMTCQERAERVVADDWVVEMAQVVLGGCAASAGFARIRLREWDAAAVDGFDTGDSGTSRPALLDTVAVC